MGVISFIMYMSVFCPQTGLIQIGEESLFIEPVDENDPSQSFSGLKHRLLRQRRSAKNSSAPEADQPSYCGTVQGEQQTGLHRIWDYSHINIKVCYSRRDAIINLSIFSFRASLHLRGLLWSKEFIIATLSQYLEII